MNKKNQEPAYPVVPKLSRATQNSESSDGEQEAYFNSQRKQLRNKNNLKIPLVTSTQESTGFQTARNPAKKNLLSEDDDEDSQRSFNKERKMQKQLIELKKTEALQIKQNSDFQDNEQDIQERSHMQKILEEKAVKKKEEERKQKERDELQAKLKRQEEERKRRKKEEQQRKDEELKLREQEEARKLAEVQKKKKQEEDELIQQELMKKQEIERIKKEEQKARDFEEKQKFEFEYHIQQESTWRKYGSPFLSNHLTHLHNSKTAYFSNPHSLPPSLQFAIQNNNVTQRDITVGRYRALLIPLGCHLDAKRLSLIIQYFLQHSSVQQVTQETFKKGFPFKCIAMEITIVRPPLNKPSLKIMEDFKDKVQIGVQVLQMMFDIADEPQHTESLRFRDCIKDIPLETIFGQDLDFLKENFSQYLHELFKNYQKAERQQDFPYNLHEGSLQNILESQMDLSHIAFSVDNTFQDQNFPVSTKESWELFQSCPQFFPLNYNKQSQTYFDLDKKKGQQILSKYNKIEIEVVSVVLNDVSYDPLIKCKSSNSVAFLLKKACLKYSLDLVGFRMAYLDDKQRGEYIQLFHEKFQVSPGSSDEQSVLVFAFRGVETYKKLELILGHFNPETARMTNQKCLRACFGRNKDQNCALQLQNSQVKRDLELNFWFGGRIQNDKFIMNGQILQKVEDLPYKPFLFCPLIQKHYLVFSPYIRPVEFSNILQRLTQMGSTILDIMKIDFNDFSLPLCMQTGKNGLEFKNKAKIQLRNNEIETSFGFLVKLARENFVSHFLFQKKNLLKDIDFILQQHSLESVLTFTQSLEDYKKINQKIKCEKKVPLFQDIQIALTLSQIDRNLKLFLTEPVQNDSSRLKSARKLQTQTSENEDDIKRFRIRTALCFIKTKSFKKMIIGETLNAIINLMDVELLSCQMIDAKRDIFVQGVSEEVISFIKGIGIRFNQQSSEAKLAKKIANFQSVVLLLRGQDIEGQIDKIYDRSTLKFSSILVPALQILEFDNPYTIFVTNEETSMPFYQFLFEKTQKSKIAVDISLNHSHFFNSLNYSRLLLESISNPKALSITSPDALQDLSSIYDLTDQVINAVCIIKPNQPMNVILRVLKQIANINIEGRKLELTPKDPHFLKIENLKFVQVSQFTKEQKKILFEHDIAFDGQLSEKEKMRLKIQWEQLMGFQEKEEQKSQKSIFMFTLEGLNAISKLKSLVNGTDLNTIIVHSKGNNLRDFYQVDRINNAFFISETVEEAKEEIQQLFFNQEDGNVLNRKILEIDEIEVQDDLQSEQKITKQIMNMNQIELALIIISPTLVKNNDFVFILDEFLRAKFTICAIKKTALGINDLQDLFGDLIPKVHTLEVLDIEFKRGESILIVLEKTKALESCQQLIGKFGIKVASDYEKKKLTKKQNTFLNSYSIGGGEENGLISEYGSYIFSFPGVEQNKQKIKREFSCLPGSNNFKICS